MNQTISSFGLPHIAIFFLAQEMKSNISLPRRNDTPG
jgi:hypothetical protein